MTSLAAGSKPTSGSSSYGKEKAPSSAILLVQGRYHEMLPAIRPVRDREPGGGAGERNLVDHLARPLVVGPEHGGPALHQRLDGAAVRPANVPTPRPPSPTRLEITVCDGRNRVFPATGPAVAGEHRSRFMKHTRQVQQ